MRQAISRIVSVVIIVVIVLAAAAGALSYVYFVHPSTAKPIIIGMEAELSGTLAPDGQQEQEGAQMAVNEINSNGGVLGSQLKLIAQDETSSPLGAAQILVNQDNASFLIGPTFSGEVESVLPFTNSHKVIELMSIASLDALMTAPQNQYLFRTTLPDSGYGFLATQWLEQIHAKTVMLEYEDLIYTHEVDNYTRLDTSSANISILSSDFYPLTATDYSTAVAKIASLKPAAVVVVMEGTNGIDFEKQYAANPTTAAIPILHLETLLSVSQNAQAVDSSVPNGMNNVFLAPSNTITNQTTSWETKFISLYHTTGDSYAQDAYATVYMLTQAIKQAGSTNTDAVASALASQTFLGPGGFYAFTSTHNAKVGAGYLSGTLYQVKVDSSGNIHYNIIWPTQFANATAINPATGSAF